MSSEGTLSLKSCSTYRIIEFGFCSEVSGAFPEVELQGIGPWVLLMLLFLRRIKDVRGMERRI